jgi:hypothetical protein
MHTYIYSSRRFEKNIEGFFFIREQKTENESVSYTKEGKNGKNTLSLNI